MKKPITALFAAMLPLAILAGIPCPDPHGATVDPGGCQAHIYAPGGSGPPFGTIYTAIAPVPHPGKCYKPGNSANKCKEGTRAIPTTFGVLGGPFTDPLNDDETLYATCIPTTGSQLVYSAWSSANEVCDYNCGS